eukprot:6195399-Pleurochrysis_carterae.AAC.2
MRETLACRRARVCRDSGASSLARETTLARAGATMSQRLKGDDWRRPSVRSVCCSHAIASRKWRGAGRASLSSSPTLACAERRPSTRRAICDEKRRILTATEPMLPQPCPTAPLPSPPPLMVQTALTAPVELREAMTMRLCCSGLMRTGEPLKRMSPP